jgi:hypothetical protein
MLAPPTMRAGAKKRRRSWVTMCGGSTGLRPSRGKGRPWHKVSGGGTTPFVLARRREPMSMAAEIQWSLLSPPTMCVPQAAVAGILEPAYSVAGDSSTTPSTRTSCTWP